MYILICKRRLQINICCSPYLCIVPLMWGKIKLEKENLLFRIFACNILQCFQRKICLSVSSVHLLKKILFRLDGSTLCYHFSRTLSSFAALDVVLPRLRHSHHASISIMRFDKIFRLLSYWNFYLSINSKSMHLKPSRLV